MMMTALIVLFEWWWCTILSITPGDQMAPRSGTCQGGFSTVSAWTVFCKPPIDTPICTEVVHLQQCFANQVWDLRLGPSTVVQLHPTVLSRPPLFSLLAICASFAYFHFWAKRCLLDGWHTHIIHKEPLKTRPSCTHCTQCTGQINRHPVLHHCTVVHCVLLAWSKRRVKHKLTWVWSCPDTDPALWNLTQLVPFKARCLLSAKIQQGQHFYPKI